MSPYDALCHVSGHRFINDSLLEPGSFPTEKGTVWREQGPHEDPELPTKCSQAEKGAGHLPQDFVKFGE